jgi:hypothetical protein
MADEPDDLGLIFWGADYRIAFKRCMRSKGWLPVE